LTNINKAGLVHGDVSPANVVVVASEAELGNVKALIRAKALAVKLIDFGGSGPFQAPGRFAGKVYVEGLVGPRRLTTETDKYAFCVLAVELLGDLLLKAPPTFEQVSALTIDRPEIYHFGLGIHPIKSMRPTWEILEANLNALLAVCQ
jgi:serine/threonine protein kinase